MGLFWAFPSPTLTADFTTNPKTVKLSFCIKESYSCITEALSFKSSTSSGTTTFIGYAKAYSSVYFVSFAAAIPSA